MSLSKSEELIGMIVAGLLSNPNVMGYNASCGRSLVNCDPEQIIEEATMYAELILTQEKNKSWVKGSI